MYITTGKVLHDVELYNIAKTQKKVGNELRGKKFLIKVFKSKDSKTTFPGII